MRTQIDYLADKYCFTERNESPRLRRQWQDVLEECRQTEAGPEERLRIALLNVDYVTSFELPFRLLLTRTPQLIAALREEWDISQKNVVFNDKRFGCVYSLKASLSGVPDTFRYHLSHRIRGYPEIAGQLLYQRFLGCAEHSIQEHPEWFSGLVSGDEN
ncbi:DNA-binding protein [Escherichia coli]|nr:DNA-binding protein [Escherichia coli]